MDLIIFMIFLVAIQKERNMNREEAFYTKDDAFRYYLH